MSESPRAYPTPNADLAAVLPDLVELVAQLREKLAFVNELPPRSGRVSAGESARVAAGGALPPAGPDNNDFAKAAWRLTEGLDALLRAATAAQAGQQAEAALRLQDANVLPRSVRGITQRLIHGYRGV